MDSGQTPGTSNTGVSIRHGGLESGGLDTLEVSLYGYWHPARWDAFRMDLDRARKRAEAGLDDTAYVVSAEGDELEVEPTGVRRGVYCRWVLNWNGCRIAIVNNPRPSDSRLSVHVTIGSVRLMEVGHVAAWDAVLAVLRCLGYSHHRDVPGRVDICTDHADWTMKEVEQCVNQRRLICRARKSKRYETNDNLETYVRGSGPLLVRIYDKAIECRNDPVKQAILASKRWGRVCDNAVRVEFQLRRKALQRHFDVQSVDDLFAKLGTIASWCKSDWFRIVEPCDRKNRNHARAGESAFWREVGQHFEHWTGPAAERTPRAQSFKPDFKILKQQVAGCVSSIVAHCPALDFLDVLREISKEYASQAMESAGLKRRKLEARARVAFAVDESQIPF